MAVRGATIGAPAPLRETRHALSSLAPTLFPANPALPREVRRCLTRMHVSWLTQRCKDPCAPQYLTTPPNHIP